jgi:hypothetical protein
MGIWQALLGWVLAVGSFRTTGAGTKYVISKRSHRVLIWRG